MPELTMKQLARANNVAIARGLNPREFAEILHQALEASRVMGISPEEVEDGIYAVLRSIYAVLRSMTPSTEA